MKESFALANQLALAAGLGTFSTYYVREVVPPGYTPTDEPPPAISLDSCDAAAIVDFVNFLQPPSS